jgi:hypothetical protein
MGVSHVGGLVADRRYDVSRSKPCLAFETIADSGELACPRLSTANAMRSAPG